MAVRHSVSRPDPLIKIGGAISARVLNALEREAARLGVSFGEALRRALDKWADDKERASQQPSQPVLVLDREKGEVRGAR